MMLTPSLVYQYEKQEKLAQSFEEEVLTVDHLNTFKDVSISLINELTVETITDKYKDIQSLNQIDFSKLKIWILIHNVDNQKIIDFDSLSLDIFKEDLKESLGITYVEINCVILSHSKFKSSDNTISSIKEAVNAKLIEYVVLLNNNNLSSINESGKIIIFDDRLFLKYGMKLIEHLHFTNYFIDELASTFNNIGIEKYIFTVGSTINPNNLILKKEKKLEPVKQPSSQFIEQVIGFFSLLDNSLNNIKPISKKLTSQNISDKQYENLYQKIKNLILEYSDKENEDNQTEKEFFEAMYSIASKQREFNYNLLVRWFILKYYTSICKELLLNNISGFISYLDNDFKDSSLIEDSKNILSSLNNESSKIFEDMMHSTEDDKDKVVYVLSYHIRKVSKRIEKWVLGKSLRSLSKISPLIKKISNKRFFGKSSLASETIDKADRVPFINFLAKKAFNKTIIQTQKLLEESEELSFLFSSTNKNVNRLEDELKNERDTARSTIGGLINIKSILNTQKDYNKVQYTKIQEKELESILNNCLVQRISFEQFFTKLINRLIKGDEMLKFKEKIKKEAFVLSSNEIPPLFACSSKLEQYSKTKQFVFTNELTHTMNKDSVVEYINNKDFKEETISLYGPWNETECLAS